MERDIVCVSLRFVASHWVPSLATSGACVRGKIEAKQQRQKGSMSGEMKGILRMCVSLHFVANP